MCGIFGGVSSHLTNDEISRVLALGVLNAARGSDSSGLAVVSKKKNKVNTEILTSLDHPFDFFRNEPVNKATRNRSPFLLMGHTRAATHGDVNQRNAQPIQHHSLIGVHNGVVPDFIPTKEQAPFRSDSRGWVESVYQLGLRRAVEKHVAGNVAAVASVFYDTNSRKLHFYRNSKRPIWFVHNHGGSTLYWSSEKEALLFAINRSLNEADKLVPYEMPANTTLVLPVGNSIDARKLQFVPLEAPPTPPSPPPTSTSVPGSSVAGHSALIPRINSANQPSTQETLRNNGIREMRRDLDSLWATVPAVTEASHTPAPFPKPSTVVPLTRTVRTIPPGMVVKFIGPSSTRLEIEEAKVFFKRNKCLYCTHHVDPTKEQCVWYDGWDSPNETECLDYVCMNCWDDKDVRDLLMYQNADGSRPNVSYGKPVYRLAS